MDQDSKLEINFSFTAPNTRKKRNVTQGDFANFPDVKIGLGDGFIKTFKNPTSYSSVIKCKLVINNEVKVELKFHSEPSPSPG